MTPVISRSERQEADGAGLRRTREQERYRRKRQQAHSVLSSISLHLCDARMIYGETAPLQPDFLRSKTRRIPSPPCLSFRALARNPVHSCLRCARSSENHTGSFTSLRMTQERLSSFQSAGNLFVRFAFLNGLALVSGFFVPGKPDQYLHAIVRSIHP